MLNSTHYHFIITPHRSINPNTSLFGAIPALWRVMPPSKSKQPLPGPGEHQRKLFLGENKKRDFYKPGKAGREVPGSRNTSLSKSLNILDCFIGNNQTRLSLSDIQGMTQIPVSTCYRLIDFLKQSGYLTKSKKDKHYSLGWKLLLLGSASAGTNRELFLWELAPPYMRLLRDCFNERFPFLFG